jgi:hypothetical protein
MGQQTLELTIYMRIWQFILQLLEIMAELINGDINELIVSNMKNAPENNRLLKLFDNKLYQQIRASTWETLVILQLKIISLKCKIVILPLAHLTHHLLALMMCLLYMENK